MSRMCLNVLPIVPFRLRMCNVFTLTMGDNKLTGQWITFQPAYIHGAHFHRTALRQMTSNIKRCCTEGKPAYPFPLPPVGLLPVPGIRQKLHTTTVWTNCIAHVHSWNTEQMRPSQLLDSNVSSESSRRKRKCSAAPPSWFSCSSGSKRAPAIKSISGASKRLVPTRN